MRTGLALILLGVLLLGGAIVVKVQLKEIDRLEQANKTLTDELATERANTKALRQNVAKATAKAQKTQRELDHALSQVPEWRDAAVPEPVRDSLCRTLRCANTNPMPAPGG